MNQVCMSFIKEIFQTSYNKDIPPMDLKKTKITSLTNIAHSNKCIICPGT